MSYGRFRIWAADQRFSGELSAWNNPFGTSNDRWKVPHTFTAYPEGKSKKVASQKATIE